MYPPREPRSENGPFLYLLRGRGEVGFLTLHESYESTSNCSLCDINTLSSRRDENKQNHQLGDISS